MNSLIPLRAGAGLLFAAIAASGCATGTGPQVSSTERLAASRVLAEKSQEFHLKQFERVSNVGYRLLQQLPTEDREATEPWIGVVTYDQLPGFAPQGGISGGGVRAAFVVASGPAGRAGIPDGALIEAVAGDPVGSVGEIHKAVLRALDGSPGGMVDVRYRDPNGGERTVGVRPEFPARTTSFLVTDDAEVNAYTDGRDVVVTGGMLRFLNSDDELAAVLGHELAHVTRGHVTKAAGQRVGLAAIGAILGAIIAPRTNLPTDMARLSVSAFAGRFNQDLEREADVYGLWYANASGYDVDAGAGVWERMAIEMPQTMTSSFFSTHPASPERFVRARKVAVAIHSGATLAALVTGEVDDVAPTASVEVASGDSATAPGRPVIALGSSPGARAGARRGVVQSASGPGAAGAAPGANDRQAAVARNDFITQVRVKTPRAEVREGPGMRYDVVARPDQGSVFVVDGERDAWYRIFLPSDQGTGGRPSFIRRSDVELLLVRAATASQGGAAPRASAPIGSGYGSAATTASSSLPRASSPVRACIGLPASQGESALMGFIGFPNGGKVYSGTLSLNQARTTLAISASRLEPDYAGYSGTTSVGATVTYEGTQPGSIASACASVGYSYQKIGDISLHSVPVGVPIGLSLRDQQGDVTLTPFIIPQLSIAMARYGSRTESDVNPGVSVGASIRVKALLAGASWGKVFTEGSTGEAQVGIGVVF